MKNHIKQNEQTFKLWISLNAKLQPSADILKPIIPEFIKENPGVNINNCPECLIDMLRWALIQIKETPKRNDK
jgi:hypothetical protein